MRGRLIDMVIGRNRKWRVTIELDSDFREGFDKLSKADIEISIKKWRARRSLDANAYFHVLVNQIAEARGVGDDEIKRDLVLEYGVIARDDEGNKLGSMLPAGVDATLYYKYAKWYKSMEVNGKEVDCYLFYKPTHEMDSKEMSRLIDKTIEVAKELGIDTDTPEQKARFGL
ncbi:MAG: hypothetical protein IJ649_10150 [Oscillospiraceae bacterium]|nr:hypothetical protein [Oscillospiraceae bacterium]